MGEEKTKKHNKILKGKNRKEVQMDITLRGFGAQSIKIFFKNKTIAIKRYKIKLENVFQLINIMH